MESDFSCNIENMVILYHSIIGESMAQSDLKSGDLSGSEIAHRTEVISECEAVFRLAHTFPGVGIA